MFGIDGDRQVPRLASSVLGRREAHAGLHLSSYAAGNPEKERATG